MRYLATTDPSHPASVIKFCPFCGHDSFVWSSEHHSFCCDSCNKRFFINGASAVVALIRDNDNKILFTRRAHEPFKGMLDLPGGFVDPGESAEEALHREIEEELGKKVTKYRYINSFPNLYPYDGLTYFTVDLFYECEIDSTSDITPMDDVTDVLWLKANEVNLEEIGGDSIKEMIKSIISF